MLNDCNFIGRLGKDPENKQVGENSVTNFSIAVSKKWKSKAGEPQEKTTWISVVVWGNQANSCNTYLKKGSQVHVSGELDIREHDGKYYTEIKANNVIFLTPKAEPINNGANTGEEIPF